VREIEVSNFSDFCRELEGKVAKEVLALGMTSEIYLLRVGVAMLYLANTYR
jgi:hypothetical protein